MFSPILPIRPLRTSSSVGPKPSWLCDSAPSAARSGGFFLAINSTAALHSARKLSFLVTKSVSQLTSSKAPVLPSMKLATTPSAVMRAAALPALLPSLTRSNSSAFSILPSASVNAFLLSIIGASVLPRSSATMLAVIAAICFSVSSVQFKRELKKRGPSSPTFSASDRVRGRASGRRFVQFHKLIAAFGRNRLHQVGHGVGTTFQNG